MTEKYKGEGERLLAIYTDNVANLTDLTMVYEMLGRIESRWEYRGLLSNREKVAQWKREVEEFRDVLYERVRNQKDWLNQEMSSDGGQ